MPQSLGLIIFSLLALSLASCKTNSQGSLKTEDGSPARSVVMHKLILDDAKPGAHQTETSGRLGLIDDEDEDDDDGTNTIDCGEGFIWVPSMQRCLLIPQKIPTPPQGGIGTDPGCVGDIMGICMDDSGEILVPISSLPEITSDLELSSRPANHRVFDTPGILAIERDGAMIPVFNITDSGDIQHLPTFP